MARRPVEFRNSVDGPTRTLPERFVTARCDTGAGLGVVGSKYEVLQNEDAFAFLQELVDRHDVLWESAGALRGGRKVFICMRLPNTVTVDAPGVADQIIPFIVVLNSHDGSSQFQVVVTPWRPVCGNTERFALRDAHARWGVRHTCNARERIEEARRTLGLSIEYFNVRHRRWPSYSSSSTPTGFLHRRSTMKRPPGSSSAKSYPPTSPPQRSPNGQPTGLPRISCLPHRSGESRRCRPVGGCSVRLAGTPAGAVALRDRWTRRTHRRFEVRSP
ncbi:hypothetical protein GCM10009827_069500 [Dactylosporangium maewongense]|uniref:Uncharacterized protein n=1 Tax=Dactylosporangium maewongense TaxID=634393 RepID=A0ABN2BG06_9ACTN